MKPIVKRLLLIGAGLTVLRVGVPTALAALHFRTTPTMREWARERPAAGTPWEVHATDAEVISRGPIPKAADPDGPERYGTWSPSVKIEHGDDVLLDLGLEVRWAATEVDDWREQDLRSEAYGEATIHCTRIELDQDFHATVVLSLGASEDGATGVPQTALDVYLQAGPGEVVLVRREGQTNERGLSIPLTSTSAASWFRARVLGLLHPSGGPPEPGLAYHAHAEVSPSWTQVKNGGSHGASFSPWEFSTSSQQYSISISGESALIAPYKTGGGRVSSSSSLLFTWNGDVW